ncbi:MAG: Lpg1974 family pore-forming outer membrane protein [Planctomycetota bacterium]
MSRNLRAASALALAALWGGAASAQTGGDATVNSITDAAVQPASCDTCETYGAGIYDAGSCGPMGCDTGGVDLGVGGPVARGQLFVGAEYLSIRTNFSEATAYRDFDQANDLETWEQFNFDYGDSFRTYIGYRLCECGGEIRFTYSDFSNGGGFTSPVTPDLSTDGRTFYGPYEVNLLPGDVLVGTAQNDVQVYDLAFSKTIPLGCLQDCCDPCGCSDTGCDDCCDPCGCGPFCPAWDIVWSGGVRFANVDSSLGYQNIRDPANTTPFSNGASTVSFDGAGLRFGLLGRRYFGRTGIVSAYVRGDISLLLGDVEHRVDSDFGFNDTAITSTQVVPVTDIEAGLTAFLTQNVSVSGGYLLSAWHDLGHRTEYNFGVPGYPGQALSMDDANLMTLDGFFFRVEAAF